MKYIVNALLFYIYKVNKYLEDTNDFEFLPAIILVNPNYKKKTDQLTITHYHFSI